MYNDQDRLYQKFNVTRANGENINSPWFVLRYAVDPHARTALLAYATSVEAELLGLAADLRAEVAKYATD